MEKNVQVLKKFGFELFKELESSNAKTLERFTSVLKGEDAEARCGRRR